MKEIVGEVSKGMEDFEEISEEKEINCGGGK